MGSSSSRRPQNVRVPRARGDAGRTELVNDSSEKRKFPESVPGFDPAIVAKFGSREMNRLLSDAGIIRNRQKLEAAIVNAQKFLIVQKEFGSFDRYIWAFVGGKPIQNRFKTDAEIPAASRESDQLSKDMKQRGFKFVGSTILYAHMQATGMVNDHLMSCFRYRSLMNDD
jgi:DNA-3-methyladenine glycosylase I